MGNNDPQREMPGHAGRIDLPPFPFMVQSAFVRPLP
jgi:hypothetical protein